MERSQDLMTPPNVINNLVGTKNATIKTEFDARVPAIGRATGEGKVYEIAKALYPQMFGHTGPATHHQIDGIIYAAKSVSGKQTCYDLFKSDDKISVGLGNLDGGRIPSDRLFVFNAISIQYAVADGVNDEDVKAAEYGLIPAQMRNGVISIEQNGYKVLDKMLMEPFFCGKQVVADSNEASGTIITYTLAEAGKVYLGNPKSFGPDQAIEVEMDFAGSLPVNAAVRIIFHAAHNVRL